MPGADTPYTDGKFLLRGRETLMVISLTVKSRTQPKSSNNTLEGIRYCVFYSAYFNKYIIGCSGSNCVFQKGKRGIHLNSFNITIFLTMAAQRESNILMIIATYFFSYNKICKAAFNFSVSKSFPQPLVKRSCK